MKMIGNPSNAGCWGDDGSFSYFVYDRPMEDPLTIKVYRVTLKP